MSATITPITDQQHDRQHGHHPPGLEESAQDLEEQICGLASQIAQSTCRFLELLGAFDQAEGWEHRGFVSASQWLSWRCGMTETTAREHMRVARALPDLPLIAAEFRAGHLSYSKVRALTRVATAETEPELLNIARGASASQLDRFISGLRRAGELDELTAEPAHGSRRAETVVHTTIEQLAQLGPAAADTGTSRLELGPALHPETARRLTCDTGRRP